jgi:flavin-dependent dehydrogenase
MIPPVTGNGMSLAFESAQLAAGPLTGYSRGEMSWAETEQAVAAACDQTFSRRLRWAGRLQSAMFSGPLQKILFALVSRSDWFWRMAFERTR